MTILEHFNKAKIEPFLQELEVLCAKHEVSLVWALNAMRIVSNNGMEIISPETRIQLARIRTVMAKGGKLSFDILQGRD